MKPGVYEMSFRGLTVREAWRFGGGPVKFALALVLKLVAFKGPKAWLPAHECEVPCSLDELSVRAQLELMPEVQQARELGYVEGTFNRLARNLDPHCQEAFSYMALHRERNRAMFIGYVLSDASGNVRSTIAATGSMATAEHDDIEFVNHSSYLDGTSTSRKIRVAGKSLADLDRAMQDFVSRSRSAPQRFASLAALQSHVVAMSDKTFDARVARGLYVYVSPAP